MSAELGVGTKWWNWQLVELSGWSSSERCCGACPFKQSVTVCKMWNSERAGWLGTDNGLCRGIEFSIIIISRCCFILNISYFAVDVTNIITPFYHYIFIAHHKSVWTTEPFLYDHICGLAFMPSKEPSCTTCIKHLAYTLPGALKWLKFIWGCVEWSHLFLIFKWNKLD